MDITQTTISIMDILTVSVTKGTATDQDTLGTATVRTSLTGTITVVMEGIALGLIVDITMRIITTATKMTVMRGAVGHSRLVLTLSLKQRSKFCYGVFFSIRPFCIGSGCQSISEAKA